MAPTSREPTPLGRRILEACEAEGRTPTKAQKEAGFGQGGLFRYVYGDRGSATLDVEKFQRLAKYLHVNFEWLVIGEGPMRRDGRGATPAEEAIVFARRNGAREDAIQNAWSLNKQHERSWSAWEWIEAIDAEVRRLERAGIPRPETIQKTQEEIRRQKRKLTRGTDAEVTLEAPGRKRSAVNE